MSNSNAKYADILTATALTTDASQKTQHHPAGISDEDHGTAATATATPLDMESMDVELDTMHSSIVKGQVQEPAYRDKWFGVAFLAHLGIIVSVTVLYATGTLKTAMPTTPDEITNAVDDDSDRYRRHRSLVHRLLQAVTSYETEEAAAAATEEDDDFSSADLFRFVTAFLLSFLMAPALAMLAMSFMKSYGTQLIQFSLYFAIGFNIVLGLFMLVANGIAAIIWFVFAAILVCYAKAVWHRIPFAAANLKAAVICVQDNGGMAVLGLLKIPILTAWSILWIYVVANVVNSPWMKSQEHDVVVTDDFQFGRTNAHQGEEMSPTGTAAVLGLLLSFYWTWHVLNNIVHTTLAGTVGTWWFSPLEASGCCSHGLTDSLSRSLTYSFGSICFGSLLVAIIEVVKSMVRSAARNRRAGILMCVAQCLLVYIERIAEYFNKWAFVYVGLYGYGYIEAGKNVFSLFKNRGWTTIISDSLVGRMLGMVCFCIGLCNAAVAAVLTLGAEGIVVGFSALIGFTAGVVLSSMVFSVLISATNSIIVLFAEAPKEFQDNHPAMSREMQDTWSQAWPDVFSGFPTAVATPVA